MRTLFHTPRYPRALRRRVAFLCVRTGAACGSDPKTAASHDNDSGGASSIAARRLASTRDSPPDRVPGPERSIRRACRRRSSLRSSKNSVLVGASMMDYIAKAAPSSVRYRICPGGLVDALPSSC